MKYLFINSVAGYGSTGRIIADTCRELTAQGHECLIAYGRMENLCPDVPSIRIGSQAGVLLHVLRTRLLDDHGYGSWAATKAFLRKVKEYDPDVIWLHNIHGYYIHIGLLFDYLHSCGKEIRWTLHDCWAFTGHCFHFSSIGCDKWKTGCSHCPLTRTYPQSFLRDNSRRNFICKRQLFTGIPKLTLYTPSHWLEQRVKQSFLKNYPVKVVYNTVDKNAFRPTPSDFRERYGIGSRKMILGVSSRWYEQKGLPDFCRMAELLDDSYCIVMIGLTPAQMTQMPKNILCLPRTSNVEELAEAYTAADLYVTPSTEETFGMTVLEAACCGTRSIVYQDTACEEIVQSLGGKAVPRGVENIIKAIYQELEVIR